ncbi:MAG: type II toxin-antitoxin system RelE/ParE family toxin [Sulfurovum sp.]
MKVNILKKAQKDISKLDKSIIGNILLAIKNLGNYPNVSNIKKLINFQPVYRKRVENYRILFDIEEGEIFVGRILHRKEAY